MILGEFLPVERAVSDCEWMINSGFQNKLEVEFFSISVMRLPVGPRGRGRKMLDVNVACTHQAVIHTLVLHSHLHCSVFVVHRHLCLIFFFFTCTAAECFLAVSLNKSALPSAFVLLV